MAWMVRLESTPGGMLTVISSHIHWPLVEKLKYWPVMAKLLMKVTRRPVGWPLSVQLPVSRSAVRKRPISTTSPPTPLISTQSPTRMPFLPMRMNQPKKARMKSWKTTVRPAASETEDGGNLVGGTEDNEENEDERYELNAENGDGAKSVEAAAVGGDAIEESAGRVGEETPQRMKKAIQESD